MNEPNQAVFLSYTSEDTAAAQRICASLRAAGVDVWFDQSELRGGDAWDAAIRKQIKACALFIPVISKNAQARAEGYFRFEWKLAVDRSHLMAADKPFLLPVVIDGTGDADARVPDRFREVQWTRLSGGDTPPAFVERLKRLLSTAPAVAKPAVPLRVAPAAQTAAVKPADNLPSIAVLPFVNLSRDEENEYFADGLSDELLNVLAKIRGLRVASRTSAFSFKGKDVDIPTVAQRLNVATVLEGSVRKSGKRVRITAQLIQVSSDSHLWSETYDRELEDIFAVQDDIAQSVVKELRAALLGREVDPAASAAARAEVKVATTGRADNPEAYRLYLQGRFFVERMTEADVGRGVAYFEQATSLDPESALAWAGLSDAYLRAAGCGWSPVAEGFERGREAARRALRLAPDLAEGHLCLGEVLQDHDWDFKAADLEFQRALMLAPGNAEVLRQVAFLAGILGRRDESIELLRRAVALDPLSTSVLRGLGLRCAQYGHLDEAVRWLTAAADLSPSAGLVHCYLSVARLMQGRAAEALDLADREALPDFRLLAVALAEHTLGNAARSDDALQRLITDHGHVAAFQIAEAFAWRGEVDRAFEWLERGYALRDPGMPHLATDEFFRVLHGDSRWAPLVKKMGLE